jgi:hypothetical protein
MVSTRNNIENTPRRWRAALKRALREGVEIRQLQGSGMWIATSASDLNTAYEVTPWECECHAGQFHDPVCKHRAALLVKLGRLRLEEESGPVNPRPCPSCRGTGIFRGNADDPHRSSRGVTCGECDGSGFASSREAA